MMPGWSSPMPWNRAALRLGWLLGAAVVGLWLVAATACGGGAEDAETEGWWSGLSPANKVFFCIAFFFSALFLWQFIMTIIGLAGSGAEAELEAGGDVEVEADMDAEAADMEAGGHVEADAGEVAGHAPGDAAEVTAHETTVSFKLLSFRSVIAGGMMFGWAGALYLYNGLPLSRALLYALAWAFGGAFVVAILMYLMRRLQETGNVQLATCVGRRGTVYMDIPASGTGKVRTLVSGAIRFVPARGAGGAAVGAGTPVRVTRLLDTSTVEVERIDE